VVGIGDVIADKYRVERLLGHGTRGYVVAARHDRLDHRVAIKVLTPERCDAEDAVARFLREARASVPFQSEHVARVLDVGTLDDGAPYMVMEFLEGRDLARELDERVTLSTSEAVDYVLQACEALAEAHALGIVHRHLKPANLFRTRRPDGTPLIKVLDFGISEALPRDTPNGRSLLHLSATEGSASSPYYLSPEELRGSEAPDPRTDIWSLGIVLYELLNGYPPRVSETSPAVTSFQTLQDVILRCLETDANRRYANVIELATALQTYTPNGAAAVARILAIVRSAKDRAPGARGATRADAPTLESPQIQREILGGVGPAAPRKASSPSVLRSRAVVVLVGAAISVVALLFKTSVTRSRIAGSGAASPSAPSTGASATSRDQDAAIAFAASDAIPVATRNESPPVQRHSPARPSQSFAAPATSSTPDAPTVDDTLDPLEGRF